MGYAALAGNTASRYGVLDAIAWYGDNSGDSRIDSTAIYNAAPEVENVWKKLYENGCQTFPHIS